MESVHYLSFSGRRNFGIEMEVGNEIPISCLREIISLNSFVPVKTSFYRASLNNFFWEVKHDGSCGKNVDKFGINEGGFEVSSYKASSIKDLIHICNIGRKLKRAGCQVNCNCGLHVHVDTADFSLEQMGILIAYWLCIENNLMQAVPNIRKNNKFCNQLSKLRPKLVETNLDPMKIWNHYKPISSKLHDNFDRRCNMNLVNYYRSLQLKNFKRPTVEFRFPEGSLVASTIKNWTRIFVNFINNVKNKKLEFSQIKTFDLRKTLEVLGLSGTSHDFAILSPGLHESKKWLLRRIVRYATYPHQDLILQAKVLLAEMEISHV
jgi:hypothetical protein